MERALLRFGMEVVLAETLQNMPHVNPMFCNRVRKNKNIIKINDDANVSHIRKNIVHEMLESRRCVGQAKGHNQVLECTIVCAEGGKPLVAFSNADVVVTGTKIDLGEYFGRPQLIKKVANKWKQVLVPLSEPIELVVVDTELERPILLLGKEDRHTDRRV